MWCSGNHYRYTRHVICIFISIIALSSGQDSRIYFPGERDEIEESDWTPAPPCVETHVFWPASNACLPLLQQGPCSAGEWLVVIPENNTAECQGLPCPHNYALWDGECVHVSNASMCGEKMSLHHNKFGVAECDCQLGHVYWLEDGKCYPIYEQGPCGFGEYLIMDSVTATTHCEKNPCQFAPLVLYNGQCSSLNSPDACEEGILRVNEMTLTLGCDATVVQHALITMPILPCSPGSRRDVLGRCKQRFRRPVLGPGVFKKAGLTRCPPGWVKTPRGRCIPRPNRQ